MHPAIPKIERAWIAAASALMLLAGATAGVAGAQPHAAESTGDDGESPAAEPAEAIAYEAHIEGVEEPDLKDVLRRTSQLVALTERPPRTLAGLQRRARDDVQRLRTALRSEGFYAARVDYTLDRAGEPVQVTIDVDPGPIYLLSRAEVIYTKSVPAATDVPRAVDDLDLEIGMRARAPTILRAQRVLLQRLENNGYPLAAVSQRRAVVDHDRTTLAVTWRIDPGPRLEFGEWRLEDLGSVERSYVETFRTWSPGEVFAQDEVAATRRALLATGLFAGVDVERGEPRDGELPVTFRFRERPHRSIGFSARFSTSEGPFATAFWEHRNILGRNENLKLSLNAGLIEQKVRADFAKPRFWRKDQKLIADTELRRLDSDAFQEEAISGFLGLERDISTDWKASAGGLLELSRDQDNEGKRTFALVGAPLTLTRDTRDDVLDPAQGSRLALEVTPFGVTVDETQAFLRSVVGGSKYVALDDADRVVLAARARLGSIVGVETEEIPAGKRFYAGGGGSIRGFDFQTVGPLDADDDPLGGRSLVELGAEIRIRITDSVGIVPFVDAGNVYDDPLPALDFDGAEQIRYAAGLGGRYFTAIGPVRVDVAVPLNPRDVDDALEFYISLGQAF